MILQDLLDLFRRFCQDVLHTIPETYDQDVKEALDDGRS
jgi:hypothetical protein